MVRYRRCLPMVPMLLGLLCVAWHGVGRIGAAHDLHVYGWIEGGELRGEVYFRDGTPARQVEVTVHDGQDATFARVTTGQDGMFAAPVPTSDRLRIRASTGDGHLAWYEIPKDELARFRDGDTSGSVESRDERPATDPVGDASDVALLDPSELSSVEWSVAETDVAERLAAVEREQRRLRSESLRQHSIVVTLLGANCILTLFLLLRPWPFGRGKPQEASKG